MKTFPAFSKKIQKLECLTAVFVVIALLLSTFIPTGAFATGTSNGITGPANAEFRAGMWWDPELNGSGWEINRRGKNVFALWYTYNEDGSPTWYLTTGPMVDGQFKHDLLSFTWDYANKKMNDGTVVGQVSIEFPHAQLAEVSWEIGEHQNTHYLRPFIFAAAPTLKDFSGSWYDPTESGYGITVQTQSDYSYNVLYYYDEDGNPIWAAGHNGGEGSSHAMQSFDKGACPWCEYVTPEYTDAGVLENYFQSESQMTINLSLNSAAPFWAKNQAQHEMISDVPSGRPHPAALATIASEDAMVHYFKAGLVAGNGLVYGPMICIPPIVSPAPPTPPPPSTASVSSTNVVEQGVDEADVIKISSGFLYSLDYGHHEIPLSEDRSERLQSITRYRIPENGGIPVGDGSYPISIASNFATGYSGSLSSQGIYHYTAGTPESEKLIYLATVTQGICGQNLNVRTYVDSFDTHQEADFQVDNRIEIEGGLISSRTIGEHLFLAVAYQPSIYSLAEKILGSEAANQFDFTAENIETLFDDIDPKILFPAITYSDGRSLQLITPDNIMMPPLSPSHVVPILSILLKFDLNDMTVVPQSVAVMGNTDGMYASAGHVYFASSGAEFVLDESGDLVRSGFANTDIHKFNIGGDSLDYLGTGTVEGYVGYDPERLAFRMSEDGENLRVLSSTQSRESRWGNLGRHRLTILGEADTDKLLMDTISYVPNELRPKTIGKPDEDIYAIRFQGKRAYVVTFKQIDPLYALDLSNVNDPYILGELEIPGYSDYLHPIGDHLLVGIGMKVITTATGSTWMEGVQVGLFDVSSMSSPVLLDKQEIGQRGSSTLVFETHHAFTALPADPDIGRPMRFIIPVTEHGPENGILEPVAGFNYPWHNTGIRMFEVLEADNGYASLKMVGGADVATVDTMDSSAERFYRHFSEEHSRSVIYDDQVLHYFRGGLFSTEWAGQTFTPADNCPLCSPPD